jgi:HIRAN domain
MERLIVFVIAVVVYLIYRAVRGTNQGPAATSPTSYIGKSYPFSEILPDPNLPQVRSIHSKIRGVTKRNADRSDRQRIIRQWCQSGDALCLVRESNNSVDRNAIQVRRIVCSDVPDKPRIGEQLGYLSRELAEEFAPRMDHDGFVLMAQILDVTGREAGASVGVNIEMSVYMPAPTNKPHLQRKKRKSRKKPEPSSDPSCLDVSDSAV